MAYWDVASLAGDDQFLRRVKACASVEQVPDPEFWAVAHIWQIAAQPGFGDAYASALVSGVPEPGKDPSVISDSQILSAVQLLAAEGV